MPPTDSASLDLAPRHLALLRELLAQHVPTAETWAYGSRVNGNSHEGSDLDLVLRAPGDPAADIAGLSALTEALQASSLPMLVDLHRWADLPEPFRHEIGQRYVVIQTGRPAQLR